MIGCTCEVCSSVNPKDNRLRTSALLSNGDHNVLIDCGPDVRTQLLRTGIQHLDAVLITHEHNDHIIGLDDLRPFMFRQKRPMHIYAEERVRQSIKARFSYAFAKTPYPGAPQFELRSIEPGKTIDFQLSANVEALRVLHGKLPILGFKIGTTAYLTDVKTVPNQTLNKLHQCETIITSALHHNSHHSHMNLTEAIDLVEQIGCKNAHLLHLSHLMGLHAQVNKALPEGITLTYDGQTFNIYE